MDNIKCILCNNKAVICHHINYEKDITIPVCKSCHRIIHKNNNHKFHPVDNAPMRTIGVDETVYEKLLAKKHTLEKERQEVISYSKIINELLNSGGGIAEGNTIY